MKPRRSRRRDADIRFGDRQCPARLLRAHDGYLCCRFVAGHVGKHKTCYEGLVATEWSSEPSSNATEKK